MLPSGRGSPVGRRGRIVGRASEGRLSGGGAGTATGIVPGYSILIMKVQHDVRKLTPSETDLPASAVRDSS